MAKKNATATIEAPAPVQATVPVADASEPKTLAELQAQINALKARKAELAKADEDAAKQREEETRERRDEATLAVGKLVGPALAELAKKASKSHAFAAELVRLIPTSTLVALTDDVQTAEDGTVTRAANADLADALKTLAELTPAKKARGGASSNGTATTRTPTGSVTAAQKRALAYMASLDVGAMATRRQLLCVAKDLPFNTTERVTSFDGSYLGNIREDNSAHPFSLLARGWLSFTKDTNPDSGKDEGVFTLTPEGRKAAADPANAIELKTDYSQE